ncbi:MAG TPA: hypothetical protein VF598_09280 [Hymenobacter sp.]|jgi:hypothetical protein
MKSLSTLTVSAIFSLLFSLQSACAQQSASRPDSVLVTVQFGSANKELNQLMTRVMRIEKLHFEAHNPSFAGKRFHLTYQEYKNGVAEPEKELVGNVARLTSFDKEGNFLMDAFSRQATEGSIENQFLFAGGMTTKAFKPLAGKADQYSLRSDIWPYKFTEKAVTADALATAGQKFPLGKKVPFLVYTLPYEEDGYMLYCSLAQSKVPVSDWYKKFKVAHFVVYNLVIE